MTRPRLTFSVPVGRWSSGAVCVIHRRNLLLAGAGLALALLGQASSAALGRDNPIVDAFVKEQGFNGVVMLDTVYGVASISKWLTAATVLKLVEAGKLSLDAPITTWTCSPTSCLGRSRRPRRPAPVSGERENTLSWRRNRGDHLIRTKLVLLSLVAAGLAACQKTPDPPSSITPPPGLGDRVRVLSADAMVIDGKHVRLANAYAPQGVPDARCWAEAAAAKQATTWVRGRDARGARHHRRADRRLRRVPSPSWPWSMSTASTWAS